ncbi:hypothetical protein [Rhizobium sp. 12,4]|uniref:hypothetical protein n=1 Tax=Rhizobium sp. 12,4 TaxID=3405135 RepID=UPI003D352AB7
MSNWAKPGVQCICIDDEWPDQMTDGRHSVPTRVPMLNEVLTISAVRPVRDRLFLYFEEIAALQASGPLQALISWDVVCFRPLLKRPTDISIFKNMLTPAPMKRVKA